MVEQNPITEKLRVRFYRAYNNDAEQPEPIPIADWLTASEALAYDGQPDRYYVADNGQRIYTETDHQAMPTRFRVHQTTYQGVPPAEQHGTARTDYLHEGEGLRTKTWHAIAFNHAVDNEETTIIAIATKGNSAPNTMVREYMREKIPAAGNLKVEQLAQKDVLANVNRMTAGTFLEISIKQSFIEEIRAINKNLADAFQASNKVCVQKELTQIIKPDKQGRNEFIGKFADIMERAIGAGPASVTKLKVGGLFGESKSTTVINLLSSSLSIDIEVPHEDSVFAVMDAETVYDGIISAYKNMRDAISEAVEVSECSPNRSSITRSTSSASTQSEPSLWPPE